MRVGIGPRNTAGQGRLLAAALRAQGVEAESFAYHQHPKPLQWPADRRIGKNYCSEPDWPAYIGSFSHLIFWNGVSPRVQGYFWWHDPGPKEGVGLMFRGSELRLPSRHRELEPWSPFGGKDPLTPRLQSQAERLHRHLATWDGPVFVATVEMLAYRPDAIWCPIIVDPPPDPRPLFGGRPVVLYNPTNGLLKGSSHVDALAVKGIDLRRPGRISPPEMLRAVADCDILIGGLVLGDYGGTEIQGMGAGRVVLANVSDRVRVMTGDQVPIVQATPKTLSKVLSDVVANPDRYREIAARGPAFVEQFHDGRYSAEALRRGLR